MTNEYFLHPVSATQARRVPFPAELPLADREAYMATPPAEVLDAADLVPFASELAALPSVAAVVPATHDDDVLTLED